MVSHSRKENFERVFFNRTSKNRRINVIALESLPQVFATIELNRALQVVRKALVIRGEVQAVKEHLQT